MGEQVQTENNNVRLQYSKVGKAEAAKFFFLSLKYKILATHNKR